MTPAEARAGFPVLEKIAYLNAGTCGPLARRTVEAMAEWEERDLVEGRGGMARFEGRSRLVKGLRERLGALLQVPPDRLVLTSSTTEGCNLVITGLDLQPDDEVVTTDAEHPGLLSPLTASGAAIKQAGVLARPAGEALDAVLAEVTPRTRLVALSHVLWMNGHVMPIAEIKRRTGLPVLVDGAQSVGAIPVDAAGVDYYTVSGQKWLCGPELTGALYVSDPASLRPRVAGFGFMHGEGVDRLALLHHPAGMLAGLLSALEDRPEWAFERAAEMAGRCREALIAAGLAVHSEPGQGTLLSFEVGGDPPAAVQRARERGVVVRSLPNGWIRGSVGWWSDESDIERLVQAFAD
ncbi:MAG: aminotransferase class V-fold PLP-dependent enzyme [Candidatus Dormibacteraeota bacterium]|nr:aminotransferase class V-fold PLP-dependent enzyme [Candidatus Dormibacteraeota bacterium]